MNTRTFLRSAGQRTAVQDFSPGWALLLCLIPGACIAAEPIGTSSLAPRLSLPAQSLVIRVAIADLDHDGRKDLVHINYGTATVGIYANQSMSGDLVAGSFAARPDLATEPHPYALAVGDVDGDGWADLVVGSRVGDAVPGADSVVSVFRNRGEAGPGTFEEKVDLAVGRTVTSVAVADLDGDGRSDIVAVNLDSRTLSLFAGLGEPGLLSFAERTDITDTVFPLAVAIGDLDGDGHPDLAVSNFDADTVSIHRNKGDMTPLSPLTFEPRIDLAAGARTHSAEMADLDGDGRLDLLVANAFANSISLYHNRSLPGSLSFAPQVILNGGSIPHAVRAADLNGDGRPELLVAAAGSRRLLVYENRGWPGGLTPGSFGERLEFVTGQNPNHLAVDDLDGDGWPDVVVVDNYTPGLSLFRNRITSPPDPPVSPVIVLQPTDVTVPVGGVVLFQVQAAGTAPLAYQWRLNDTALPGAIHPTLTFVAGPGDAGDYSVLISNGAGEISSDPARLTVVEPEPSPPMILAQPRDGRVQLGGSVTFSVVATGAVPLTYQWFYNGEPLLGETFPTLRILTVSPGHAGLYQVAVANPAGSVRSREAVLILVEAPSGAVNFANVSAPVTLAGSGERLPAGDAFRAQLYAGSSPGEIVPVGIAVSFIAPGIFVGGTRVVPTVPAGGVAWVQVRVWEAAFGATYEAAAAAGGINGTSTLFSVVTGGGGSPPVPPAALSGLMSFTLGNEGTVLSAQALARPARLSGPRMTDQGFGFNLSGAAGVRHRIEYSTDARHWSLLLELPDSLETLFVLDPEAGVSPARFYRVISDR